MRAVIGLILAIACAKAQQKEFSNWPDGMSPRDVGKEIVEYMLPRGIPGKAAVHYAEDSTWYAGLEFAKLTKDQAMTDALVKRYDPGGLKKDRRS